MNPNCPICKGSGWHESPNYSGFSPALDAMPCPSCHPIKEVPTMAIMFGLFTVLVILCLLNAWLS